MFDHIITLSLNPAIDATLWVEGIQTGADNAVLSEKYESAGKAMNVSRALRIYGVESLALVLAGAHNRERNEEPLKREGIRYTILPVPGYTRENIAIVEESRTVTRFLREGFTVPYEAVEELLLLLGREVRERTLVVISGTLPAGISDQILLDICLAIRERGGLVALDTSARFTLEEIGRFTPWLIKPNRKELEEMARRILMISGGKLAFDGSFDGLREITGNLTRLRVTTDGRKPALEGCRLISEGHGIFEFEADLSRLSIQGLLEGLSRAAGIRNVEIGKAPIEQVIAQLYQAWDRAGSPGSLPG